MERVDAAEEDDGGDGERCIAARGIPLPRGAQEGVDQHEAAHEENRIKEEEQVHGAVETKDLADGCDHKEH